MILNPLIKDYLHKLHPKRDPILEEMENYGTDINFPIIGPLVGTILYQYTLAMKAKRILELGSGFGYSAYWFALGLPNNGEIICSDFSEKNKQKAEYYFKRAKIDHKIQFLVGDALEVMEGLPGEFDIILNDVDKIQYPKMFEPAINRLRVGGILLTDNVLRDGKVADKSEDANVNAIREYNKMMFESSQVISSILPIRDGLGVCVKI